IHRARARREIAVEKCLPNVPLPASGPELAQRWLEPRRVFDGKRCRRVCEASQHSRDVTQRRCLLASLAERACWLTLAVDDQQLAVGGAQHLAEMIVAVNPYLETQVASKRVHDLVDPSGEMLAAPRERTRLGVAVSWESGCIELALEQRERIAHRLVRA